SGVIQSGTEFGIPNIKKMAASQVSPYLAPGLPGYQELTRGEGIILDPKLATVWDYLIPLPTSPRAQNVLGDPVGTHDDLQRWVQTMTAGSYPVVDLNQIKSRAAYSALLESGYRPPAINPNKGYAIGGDYRPMTDSELEKYTEARSKYLKQELS